MLNKSFCHLHVHNEYSLLDGYGSAEQYVKRAREMGFEYLGLTNHGNVDGLIKFQEACDKYGIKPVLGAEMYIVKDAMVKEKGEKRQHVVLLIRDEGGWEELCRLITLSNLEGFYKKPRIDYDMLLTSDLSGFVIMTACVASMVGSVEGSGVLCEMKDRGASIYLEIMPHSIEEQIKINEKCMILSQMASRLQMVATNDCHYVLKEHMKVQEILLAIQRKAKWDDKDRWRFDVEDLYLRSTDEMAEAFNDQGQFDRGVYLKAMRNTVRIARECCDFRIPKKKVTLPTISDKPDASLTDLCRRGIVSRLGKLYNNCEYSARVDEELRLIKKKGFSQYFLIVKELVDWCKENDIMIGVGRGSVGGSLVAYLLEITMIDPLKYDLLFSRFISDDRIDMPDIDVDFEDIERHRVRKHLEDLYGENNVAGVSTFLKMKGRAALRDVARVFDVDAKAVDMFAKVMTTADAEGNYIVKFSETTEEGREFKSRYPEVFDFAVALEGQVRGAGQHAAAIVISDEDLTKGTRGNLCRRANVVVNNWDMKDSEHVGLLKLDVLGLNTLTVLHETKRLLERTQDFDFNDIPLDDKKVFRELAKGNTVGVFQLSTWVSTDLCKRMRIGNFEDIVVTLALARPGALGSGMTDDYIARKKGKRWKRKHKIYERITKETYGVTVFQEQIMMVIHEMAGLDYSDVDTIRRVIGKKRDRREFEPYEQKFVKGCLKLGTFSKKEAEQFWEGLLHWAGYGFNRSHAVGYGMLAYWTAWCKVHYPVEFLCASLTYGSELKKEDLVDETRRLGLRLMPPKMGISDSVKWTVGEEDGVLYVPFVEIKGVGEKMAEKCIKMIPEKKLKTKTLFKGERVTVRVGNGKRTKLDRVLETIGAFEKDKIPSGINENFTFDIVEDNKLKFDDVRIGRGAFHNEEVVECTDCELYKECTQPVVSSLGLYDVMIFGEAPGRDEDREGKGFVGRAGQLLWDELDRYRYKRRFFHVSNCVKCYPKKTGTPTQKHIDACWKWAKEEIEELDCQLILAFGNTGLRAFSRRESGITKVNGKCEWSSRARAWVCYCVHPASVLHAVANRDLFEEGIRNFVDILDEIRGKGE